MIKSCQFQLRGGRSGVLLIHGLTGTPTEKRFVGNGLNRAGFSMLGMQLAGHCGDGAGLSSPTAWGLYGTTFFTTAGPHRRSCASPSCCHC